MSEPPFYSPYGETRLDQSYNMFFCDDVERIRSDPGVRQSPPWGVVLGEQSSLQEIQSIAMNDKAPSRLRAFAFLRLRAAGVRVPPGIVLGVIVEVTATQLQDTQAAFADGNVVYLLHARAGYADELQTPRIVEFAQMQVAEASKHLAQFDRWDGARRPPPTLPLCRVSVLASDGLYMTEGSFDRLFNAPHSGMTLRLAQLIQVNVFEQWKARAARAG